VAIFDDVLAARREVFHIPGLDVGVYGNADDVQNVCHLHKPDVVCMDYAMGEGHVNGAEAIAALRAMGFAGSIVAMSSDPAANQRMLEAGADDQILQKAMLRSYLVALGAGRIEKPVREGTGPVPALGGDAPGGGGSGKKDPERGGATLSLLCALGALGAFTAAALVGGPGAWAARYRGDLVRLDARVLTQGAPASPIDGAPAPLEAVAVWAKRDHLFQMVAGSETLPEGRFAVATGGRRLVVRAETSTRWHLNDGPAKRLVAPAEVPQGQGVVGLKNLGYVAKSRRITEGQDLWIVGFPSADGEELIASEIADETRLATLGLDLVPRPGAQAGGFALLCLGVALLTQAGRAPA
jgi:CheY-like chemotaxis protein